MESPLPYHCYYCNATFVRLDQMKKHSTEIHSHHCLYCDTTFPQFDDLLKHSRENHPYHCYYCKTTFVLFEEVIKHSTQNHGSLMLKDKYLKLNPSSGHYGYRSHNFNAYVFVNMAEKVAFINKCFATNLAFPFVLIGI